MVEHQLPKLRVAGSSPVARSKLKQKERMERTLKLDLLSLAISLFIHFLVIFFTSSIPQVLSVKTYQVLDILTLTFDAEVDSEFLAERSLRGEKGTTLSKKSSSAPEGDSSKRSGIKVQHLKVAKERGTFRTSTSSGRVAVSSSLNSFSSTVGNGNRLLSVSYDSLENKHGKKVTAVRADLLVPYLLKVRDRIMANWKLPYIGKSDGSKVIVYLTIDRNGRLSGIDVEKFSSNMAFNRSVISAIYSSEPFSPIPDKARVNKVKLKVNFEVK